MITNLAVNQTVVFTIPAKEFYSKDILPVNAGEQYQFYCYSDQKWKDWFVTAGPDGYFNFFAWLIGCRLRKAWCFCLCGVYDQDDSTAFAIGRNNTITLESAGAVSFFANDVKWAYRNNSGAVKLNITRLR